MVGEINYIIIKDNAYSRDYKPEVDTLIKKRQKNGFKNAKRIKFF